MDAAQQGGMNGKDKVITKVYRRKDGGPQKQ
jgi:hypothetical protein